MLIDKFVIKVLILSMFENKVEVVFNWFCIMFCSIIMFSVVYMLIKKLLSICVVIMVINLVWVSIIL